MAVRPWMRYILTDQIGISQSAPGYCTWALGRKITAWTQYDVAGGGGDSQTADLRFYHNGQLEIADYHSDGTLARRFVNGTQYVDERVALIEGEAGEADTFYYLLQELFTVTGLVEKNGALAEAAVYDGYGKVRLWDYSPGDFDRDGDVDATDQTTFTTAMGLGAPGTPTPDPSTDLDMDGDTDLTDAGLFNTIKNSGGAVAERFVSSLGNPFHFTGRRLYMLETLPEADATPVANQQLQHNRARHYSPLEGRWLQRDPMEYVDGAHLYEYARSRSINRTDWDGFRSQVPEDPTIDLNPITSGDLDNDYKNDPKFREWFEKLLKDVLNLDKWPEGDDAKKTHLTNCFKSGSGYKCGMMWWNKLRCCSCGHDFIQTVTRYDRWYKLDGSEDKNKRLAQQFVEVFKIEKCEAKPDFHVHTIDPFDTTQYSRVCVSVQMKICCGLYDGKQISSVFEKIEKPDLGKVSCKGPATIVRYAFCSDGKGGSVFEGTSEKPDGNKQPF
ncbi:MAG: hypothetical protein FLDDKLPJ_03307 [Phycisphaerae bacterium]|nr:hypothetical protein [Phycisphaerae bacterium]